MSDIEIQVEDKRSGGWYKIQNAFLEDYGAKLGPYGIAVYNALAMYGASRDRGAWPKQSTIAALIGMSRRKVNETLDTLEELQLVTSEQTYKSDGGMSGKRYHLNYVTTMNAVTDSNRGCNSELQLNKTNRTRHTTYGDSPNPPDPPSGVEESSTPREVVTEWERTKGQTLRSRCLQTIRSANEQLTANGKPDPRAKASALLTIYLALFGDTYPPEIPRLMKLAGQSGGPERFVLRMLEASTREVVGNPHDLLTRWKTDTKGGSTPSNGYSPWDLSSD